MNDELVRFSVAMPKSLLERFDGFVARRGVGKNRSEVVRDLVREALVQEACADPDATIMGTLTIVYEHHASDLQHKLHEIQHHDLDSILVSSHVHLDPDNCLEVLILRGTHAHLRDLADKILGTKGVKTGKLVLTTAAEDL